MTRLPEVKSMKRTMNSEKRKRLETVGWRVTTAKELLNLSDTDMIYIETKLALKDHLRELRRKKGVKQVELAKLMHTSQSRVAKMEAGDPTVTIDLIIRALFTLGATRKELARAVA
jgi:DNA-binding transcriptional regulator YiaG